MRDSSARLLSEFGAWELQSLAHACIHGGRRSWRWTVQDRQRAQPGACQPGVAIVCDDAWRRLGLGDQGRRSRCSVLVFWSPACWRRSLRRTHSPPRSASRYQAPGAALPMGTDDVGFDVFSRSPLRRTGKLGERAGGHRGRRIIIGALDRIDGREQRGGWVDSVLMRITDAFLALPAPMLALAVVASLGALAHACLDGRGGRLVARSTRGSSAARSER